MLEEEGELSVTEMAELQLDDRSPIAPLLVAVPPRASRSTGSYYSAGQELLRTWDYSQSADSPAAAYFNVVWSNVLELTFHDDLARGHLAGRRPALGGGDVASC